MAPSGVPILRPPANALPPGGEWQETQSPARARYSPRLAGGLTFSSARDVAPAKSKISPQKTILETVVTSLRLLSSSRRPRFLSVGARRPSRPFLARLSNASAMPPIHSDRDR